MWDALGAVDVLTRDGKSPPTTEDVAEEMRLKGEVGDSTVRRYLRALEDAGHVVRDEEMVGGQGRRNVWTLADPTARGVFLGAKPKDH